MPENYCNQPPSNYRLIIANYLLHDNGIFRTSESYEILFRYVIAAAGRQRPADEPAASPAAPRKLEGILSVGYTYGGDTCPTSNWLAAAYRRCAPVPASSPLAATSGARFRRSGCRGTFGYHFHAVTHDGGTAYFTRYPLEITPFVYLGDKAYRCRLASQFQAQRTTAATTRAQY